MRQACVVAAGLWLAAMGAGGVSGAVAQEFRPPQVGAKGTTGTRIGLFGFGTRGGIDLRSPSQMVFGVTLDMGDLFSPRVRLRPSGEIGVFNGVNSFVASGEVLYRFTEDDQPAIPYLGTGLSVAGHESCGTDPNCPGIWLNLAFGFELRYRSTFNWLLEYHAMDALRHNRLYIGLTTRRGN